MYDYSINEMTLDHNYFEKRIFSNDDYTIPFRPISNVSSNFEINNYYEDLSKKDSNNLELSVKKMNEINDSKIFEDFSINKGMQNVKTNKDNKHNKKNSQNDTNSKTFLGKKHKHSIEKIFDRKHQIDNFSQKFLKAVNDWILSKINNKIKKLLNDKFHPPNYDIITHNSNKKDLYFYINLKLKNILTFTKNDKQMLDELRQLKGDKKRKLPKAKFNEKEKNNLIKLLEIYNKKDISNKNDLSEKDINSLIQILIDRKYKNKNHNKLIYSDKNNLNKLLIENKIIKEKKSYNLQEHNNNLKKEIEEKKIDIPELEMKYYQLIKEFMFDSDYNIFKNNEDIIQIDVNFQKLKNKSKYSLLGIYKDKIGFIKMIEEDSGIKESQKVIYNEILEYFNDKELNEKEIKKYIDIIKQNN